MNNVLQFDPHEVKRQTGGNDGGSTVEARVAKLESDVEFIKRDVTDIKGGVKTLEAGVADLRVDVARLEGRIANIETNMTTKADLEKSLRTMQKWLIGAVFAGISILFTALKMFP